MIEIKKMNIHKYYITMKCLCKDCEAGLEKF